MKPTMSELYEIIVKVMGYMAERDENTHTSERRSKALAKIEKVGMEVFDISETNHLTEFEWWQVRDDLWEFYINDDEDVIPAREMKACIEHIRNGGYIDEQ